MKSRVHALIWKGEIVYAQRIERIFYVVHAIGFGFGTKYASAARLKDALRKL